MSFVRGSNSALSSSNFFFSSSSSISNPSFVVDFNFFPSNSFNCCTAYSSMGSTMYRTSKPFFLSDSKKGDEETAAMLSPPDFEDWYRSNSATFVRLVESSWMPSFKHLPTLLHQVFLYDTEDFVLLKCLPRNVQWQILRIHHTLHHVEPFWHEFIAIIHDEDTTHIQFDIVSLLFSLKQIKRSPSGHEKESTKLKLSFNTEMFHCQMILPII